MTGRRTFLTRSLGLISTAIGSAALTSGAKADQTSPQSLEANKHQPLPSFKKGSRLLFQGDSITDMKWGRN
jgi:hypothetical protein